MYEDKILKCKDCGEEFTFTAGEQEFYAERGFQNEPQRCKNCRDARKNSGQPRKELFTAVLCELWQRSSRSLPAQKRQTCILQ